MDALIGKEDAAEIGRIFRANLRAEVRVLLFTSKTGCLLCDQSRQLLEEVASLSDKVRLEVLDKDEEIARAAEMAVEVAPTTVVISSSDGAKLHFVGIPAGRQLGCLVEGIVDASRGSTQMDEKAPEHHLPGASPRRRS